MCGLVGVMSSNLADNHKKMFHNMLHFDVLRGEDSTGVACIGGLNTQQPPSVEVFKTVGPPTELFFFHGVGAKRDVLSHKPTQILLGHNRFATQGQINEDNAHPFDFPNLVGAHNGTLQKYQMSDFVDAKTYDVDSQILFSEISHQQDVRPVWEQVNGPMALTWFDKLTKKLHLARNKERPLFYAITEDKKSLFWASESWMIIVGALRNNIKIHDVQNLPVEVLHTISFNEKGEILISVEDLPKYKIKPFSQGYYQQGYKGLYGRMWDDEDDEWSLWNRYNKEEAADKKREETPPKAKSDSKVIPDCLIITEVHKPDDKSHFLVAIGEAPDGREVKIVVEPKDQEEALKKMVGRGLQGYYTSLEIYRSELHNHDKKIPPFFVHWSKLNWAKSKDGFKIVRKNNGGWIVSKTMKTETTSSEIPKESEVAPWFGNAVFISKTSWEGFVDSGCDCCGRHVTWEERHNLVWKDKLVFICPTCKEEPQIQKTA